MADNVTLPGTGAVMAADDVSGVQYQYVKLVNGTADATDKIPGEATYGLDVDVTRMASLPAGSATIGSVKVAETGQTLLYVKAALEASKTAVAILTPNGGKKWVLKRLWVSITTAYTGGDCYFFDNTDSATTCVTPGLRSVGLHAFNFDTDAPYRCTAANNVLKYTSGSGGAGSVMAMYWEE